jgi:predicted esterase YcpF (UPF0227 family)
MEEFQPIEMALFYQLKELKSRVDNLEADRRTLDERLKAEQAKHDYEPMKQKVMGGQNFIFNNFPIRYWNYVPSTMSC